MGNRLVQTNTALYSLYFLRGLHSRRMSLEQSRQVGQIMSEGSFQTSTMLYNSHEVVRKVHNWRKALPWIKMHYAIKSNPCLPILNDLQAEGAGYDCASRSEIESVLEVGASRNDIVYSNTVKDESDLAWAERNGVQLTTADTIDELLKIQQLAPNMGVLWRIAIKEEASDNLATPFSGKFGDDLETTEEIHHRMQEIADMSISLRGIHFHCGSGQHGSSGFGKAVKLARECIRIGRVYGHRMDTMDIGGGFPQGDLNPKTIEALEMTRDDPLGYRVIAEPGRHICANAFHLLTRVLARRVKSGKPCYHLNESLYHSFNCNLMDGASFEEDSQFYRRLDSQQEASLGKAKKSTLFGMTCDGMDIIASSLAVPSDMKVGDWLCFSGMGAYTYGCRSQFNGMKSTERIVRWNSPVEEAQVERKRALAYL